MSSINTFGFMVFSGKDAATFLQGQLTTDVNALDEKHASVSACCNQKGRIVANFLIWRWHDDFYCFMPQSIILILEKHLQKYAVFSKVTMHTDKTCHTDLTPHINATLNTLFDMSQDQYSSTIRLPGKNPLYLIFSQEKLPPNASIDWETWLVETGVVFIRPDTSGLFTPQMIQWEKFNGVSFTKGCYLGQEIIARTQHLGKLKRHLHRAQVDTHDPIKIGSDITNAAGKVMGVIVAKVCGSEHCHVLAVIEDRAINDTLSVEGKVLQLGE